MSEEEKGKVTELMVKMLAETYYNMGYRKGRNTVLCALGVLASPFIYLAVKDHIIKKRQEKTEK